MPECLVIALGGNAITRPGEPGTIPQQFAHTMETLELLKSLFHSDRKIVITHGNGPQIGNILIRSEDGERRVPPLPLASARSRTPAKQQNLRGGGRAVNTAETKRRQQEVPAAALVGQQY